MVELIVMTCLLNDVNTSENYCFYINPFIKIENCNYEENSELAELSVSRARQTVNYLIYQDRLPEGTYNYKVLCRIDNSNTL